MLNILRGHDQIIRDDYTLDNLAAVIKEGMVVKLNSSLKVVVTGADASVEDFVWWAFNGANVAGELNSAFKTTGNITLIANSVFIADTDQYVTGGTYVVGTKLSSENGLLFNGASGDFAVARALGAPVDGVLTFISLALAGKI